MSRAIRLLTAVCLIAINGSPASAGEIYLCKAYNGSTFWSQAHCNQHRAFVERIEQVADVPWDQQVQQAEQRRSNRGQAPNNDRDIRCQQMYAELRSIEKRYEAGYWQDVPAVNQDQARTRALRAELSSNRCSMR